MPAPLPIASRATSTAGTTAGRNENIPFATKIVSEFFLQFRVRQGFVARVVMLVDIYDELGA